jgi:outer membrane protease
MAQGLALPAQEADAAKHGLSLGVSTGLLTGVSEKNVHRTPLLKLSQLSWEMKPLAYVGFDLRYDRRYDQRHAVNAYFAGITAKFGFPGKTGRMEDRDWMVREVPDFLTHYSVHNNRTDSAVLIDANLGAAYELFQKFLFKIYATYSFMYFSWTATGGSILYPETNTDPPMPDPRVHHVHSYKAGNDKVITYTQAWHIIAPAVAFYGAFNRYFDIEIALKLSPLVWASTEDRHLLRSLSITDDLDIGLFIEPALVFSFKANDWLTVSLSVAYRQISGIRGDSTYAGGPDFPEPEKLDGIGGAGYSVFDTGITAKFKVF